MGQSHTAQAWSIFHCVTSMYDTWCALGMQLALDDNAADAAYYSPPLPKPSAWVGNDLNYCQLHSNTYQLIDMLHQEDM